MKAILFLLSGLLICLGEGMAVETPPSQPKDKSVIINIPTDQLPPASAEEEQPTHPFFSASSPSVEVMEKIQELEERVEKLEKRVSQIK